MTVAETKRLVLRETTVADAEQAYLLNFDPEVTKYTGDAAFKCVEEAREFLSRYDHFRVYGFGRWAVIEKSSGEFLGWCGLKYTPELNEHDIGFRFFRKHWGKGFATESALASLELGFKRFGLREIVGRAAKENTTSIRVLQKIGLSWLKDDYCHGDETAIYKIDLEDYLRLSSAPSPR